MLRPDRVPAVLVGLLPLAARWGIGDDIERTMRVDAASPGELSALTAAVDEVDEGALYGWLSGPESYSPDPTPEYVAITCLTMAADQARVLLDGAARRTASGEADR
jgi:hypothetical protein